MTVYHGSYIEIQYPDLNHSRKNVDFGRGFYTTTIKSQAEKWSEKFRTSDISPIISVYDFCEGNAANFCVKKFESYNEEWLDFIVKCRKGQDASEYDIVMGGVADDRVFNTIELYLNDLIEKKEALKRLVYEKPNYQIVFKTEQAIENCLKFKWSEQI